MQQNKSIEEYANTGIGLTNCKKIIQQYKGRVFVIPNPDKGSTFCFDLPLEIVLRPDELPAIQLNSKEAVVTSF